MQNAHITSITWKEQTAKHILPIQPTPLLGREQEIASARRLLQRPEMRLLTLVGPAGVGKTRLALQVAVDLVGEFGDGVHFVSLAPINDPALIMYTIARTLGLREKGDQLVTELLQGYLQDKHLLLILDNYEQLLPAGGLTVADLLATGPHLKMLVTSREALRIRAEQQFVVPPLALPNLSPLPESEALLAYAAIALFVQRAQAIKPDFIISKANAQSIAAICHRLDGLPLAIELAAARIKLLSPQALLARLERRLQLLTQGPTDLPERQKALRDTIKWSYDLLKTEEQQLFRRLAIFVGGCNLEAVEAVCKALDEGETNVLEGVISLLNKSLLQRVELGGDEQRLLMLETIREYGLECLAASGEAETTRYAHAAYYLMLAEKAEQDFGGPQQAAWLNQLERERDNLRAALSWSVEQGEAGHSMEMALRLSGTLQFFWVVRGYFSEGQNFLERALAQSEGVVLPVRAKALRTAARLMLDRGDQDRAKVLCEESLALYRKLGDRAGIAHSLYLLGMVAWSGGNPEMARSLTEEALVLSREVDDQEGIASSYVRLAFMAVEQGEYIRARTLFEESLALFRKLGNKRGIATSLFQLAELLFVSQGDSKTVRLLLEESLALFKEVGDQGGIGFSLRLLGRLALSQGDAATARKLLEESVVVYRETGQREGFAASLSVLARVVAAQDNLTTARALYEESLVLCMEIGFKLYIAFSLEGLASVVAAQGERAWAARLWGAAEILRETMGTPIPPVERASYEHAAAAARLHLGERTFATAWAEGRSMTPEQALAVQVQEERLLRGVQPPPPYPAGLTKREVEVLRLVAKGLTIPQIAEQLIISFHTANAHVRSIYNKLEVSSRSAATRYAIEHHLA